MTEVVDPTVPVDVIRFGVGSPARAHSSVWTMWATDKGDTYFTAQGLNQLIKVSLHVSGDWRIAQTSQSYAINPLDADDRILLQWRRPEPFTEGWTQGPAILVPGIRLLWPLPALGYSRRKPVDWLPPPNRGDKVVFTVLVADADAPITPVPCRPTDLTAGHLLLSTGERVWLLIRYEAMGDEERNYLDSFADDMRFHFDEDPGLPSSGMFMLPTEGEPVIANFALGKEHVVIRKPGAAT